MYENVGPQGLSPCYGLFVVVEWSGKHMEHSQTDNAYEKSE